jgi:predicted dehydrogenase
VSFLLDHAAILESRVYKSQHFTSSYEDNAVITLRFEGDIIANLITNWLTPFKKRTIEVATDKAYYEANLISRELKAYSHYTTDNSYVVRSCNVRPGEPLSLQLQAFLEYIQTGQQDCLATLHDGIHTIEIIEKHRKIEAGTA